LNLRAALKKLQALTPSPPDLSDGVSAKQPDQWEKDLEGCDADLLADVMPIFPCKGMLEHPCYIGPTWIVLVDPKRGVLSPPIFRW